jgi:hypothetical protein
MPRRHLLSLVVVACAAIGVSMPDIARATGEESLRDRLTYSRAVEAVIWSLPLMNFKAMRDGHMEDAGLGFNDVAYNSKVQDWRLQITTPNNTTPYVMAFWDVSDGPVVVEIPKTEPDVGLFGVIMDFWQRPLEDVGGRGKDQGLGGKYLIMPPNYRGALPVGGYIPLHQKTNQGYFLLRPLIADTSEANLKKAEAFVKKIKIYPLADAANPPETRHVDTYGTPLNALPDFDGSYFEDLSKMIQEEIVLEQDLAIMGLLRAIGIGKGLDFAPDDDQLAVFDEAAKETLQYLIEQFHNVSNVKYYAERQWTTIAPPGRLETEYSWVFPTYIALEDRGAYFQPIFSSVKTFGAATFYLANAKDVNGDWLDGGKTYKLTVPADAPVKNFWSVIAYDLETGAFIPEMQRDGIASSTAGIETNADGSVDVYFGPSAPEGKEANFVPTADGRRFFVLFRFYGPEPAVFDKSWMLNDFEPMQ